MTFLGCGLQEKEFEITLGDFWDTLMFLWKGLLTCALLEVQNLPSAPSRLLQ